MNSHYKPRSSDEALAEHLSLQKANHHTMTLVAPQRISAAGQVVAPSNSLMLSAATLPRHRETTTGPHTNVYVINSGGSGGGGVSVNGVSGGGMHSNPTTMERRQQNRLSWTNMRRAKAEAECAGGIMLPITPSPQTTRSYISTISMGTSATESGDRGGACTGGGGAGNGGTLSGRTTVTSGRMSSSGIITMSGSNNTLNDIHQQDDYHHDGHQYDQQHPQQSQLPPQHSTPAKSYAHNNSTFNNLANGSTVKLLPAADDESNQQTRCSVFRGLVLCICLNVSYANVVRFPRELDRYGLAYLIPYIILLFLVGLPMILLEISVGQFLGQGAAHTWRASPIFKGACIISRFASWLSTVWVSLQAVLAVGYIGMFAFNTMPFRECVGNLKMNFNGYEVIGTSGQDCMQHTFLTPFWKNPLYFGLLAAGLICIWIVVMLCTHNGKVLRRSLFVWGLIGFFLLSCLTGWEVHNAFARKYFPELWPFDSRLLAESNIWFNALMQVLYSVSCGFGTLPMLTGKFLYKGDAVRTSVVYLCFNLLVNAIAVTLFMVQFDLASQNPTGHTIDELKPLTAVYDRILNHTPSNDLVMRLIPTLIYALIIIAALVSITVAIYTSTRLVPRRPNYVICLVALVASVISFSAPKFIIARVLDTRIVGTMVITALVFELIAITWIYGAKNIYTDLEFSIGRPICKCWMWLWCICPAILTGILVWWCADDDQYDLMAEYMPRWAPILFVLGIIMLIACVQIFRQVEYNFFGMICEASKSAKEWGPADPLARHAWKQWRSVCQDTGRRDFTLRRRGTRDYTHSIKKGQYSTQNKYAANGQLAQQQQQQQTHWKSSTPGNSSPNYSGSMFGDSAIEEDISVDKFPGISQQQFVPFPNNDGKPLRYSHRTRERERDRDRERERPQRQMAPQPPMHVDRANGEKHREVVYIRRMSDGGGAAGGIHATRIEITPSNESISYAAAAANITRNPLGRSTGSLAPNAATSAAHIKRSASSVVSVKQLPPPTSAAANEHICWRKFNVNPEEYSTEL